MEKKKLNPLCPKCGKRMQKMGFAVSRKEGRRQRYRCIYCGHTTRKGDSNE